MIRTPRSEPLIFLAREETVFSPSPIAVNKSSSTAAFKAAVCWYAIMVSKSFSAEGPACLPGTAAFGSSDCAVFIRNLRYLDSGLAPNFAPHQPKLRHQQRRAKYRDSSRDEHLPDP